MKKILLSTMLISLFLSGLTLGNLKAQTVGEEAPDFSLETTKGNTFTLSEQKGKVVFIFLFGNTCPHCISNGPNTEALYQTFKNNDDFVAIGVDVWNGNASKVASYKNRTGITYNLALNGASLTSLYSSTYDRILVIDQNGILQYKSTANAASSETARAAAKIEMLLMDTSTGISDTEISEKTLKVYPNPVINEATVQFGLTSGEKIHINLMDQSGKIVLNQEVYIGHSGEFKLNVEKYPAGYYFLRAKSGNQIFNSKIIVM